MMLGSKAPIYEQAYAGLDPLTLVSLYNNITHD